MRIGTVCYATSRGLGHLAKSFIDHGVVTDIFVIEHSGVPTNWDWYPNAPHTPIKRMDRSLLRDFASKMDAMLFFETPFDWSILGYCREKGIKTFLMTMYECTPKHRPHEPDVFICPSLLDIQYFPERSVFLPIPVDTQKTPWKLRERAETFIHNGGYLGLRGREGTTLLIDAMDHVKSPIRLILRVQENVKGIHLYNAQTNPKIDYRPETIPYGELYATGDVAVMPQKFNGCSLPIQEAYASGLLVMTTNRFPMNWWLPTEPMIPIRGSITVSIGGAYLNFEESVIAPSDIAATIDYWYGKDISEFSLRAKQWAEDNSWEALKPEYLEVLTQ